MKLNNIDDRREVVRHFVASQGDSKSVREFLKSLEKSMRKGEEQHDAEEFLSAFKGGFKGIA